MKYFRVLLFGLVVTAAGKSFAMQPGHYVRHQPDGSEDILIVFDDGRGVMLKETRQVGGINGFRAVVPYPTICRETLAGQLVGLSRVFNIWSFTFQVEKVLGESYAVGAGHPELNQEANDKNCERYISEYDEAVQNARYGGGSPLKVTESLTGFQQIPADTH